MRDAPVPARSWWSSNTHATASLTATGCSKPWPASSSAKARMSRTVRGRPAHLEGSTCSHCLDGGRYPDTDDDADLAQMAVRFGPEPTATLHRGRGPESALGARCEMSWSPAPSLRAPRDDRIVVDVCTCKSPLLRQLGRPCQPGRPHALTVGPGAALASSDHVVQDGQESQTAEREPA